MMNEEHYKKTIIRKLLNGDQFYDKKMSLETNLKINFLIRN